jgi:hypothetical protein
MPFNALLSIHPMTGVDFHDGIPPPGPVIVPKMPHFVIATLKWALPISSPTTKTFGPFGMAFMQQGTDIGNFIPHVSANYLLPLVIATSGSKSHFGASTVKAEGTPMAAAIGVVFNLNLNCSGAARPPMPTGIVIAPNSVCVGLTLGDILGGLFAMAADLALQYALNRIFASAKMTKLFTWAQGPIIRALVPNAPRFLSLTTALTGQAGRILSNPVVANTLGNLIPTGLGVLFGSPLGFSFSKSPGGLANSFLTGHAQNAGQSLGNSIDRLFNDPNAPEYPGRPRTF